MATEIIPTRHECYEELTRLKLLYNEEHERADRAEQEVARLREVLGWYANEQNYTWSGAPGHWEEKIYHKTAVKIPVPDMGQRAREALKDGQE